MERQADDADFCVSWLLGLQPRRSSRQLRPRLLRDHESADSHFTVSWLLGLKDCSKAESGTCAERPEWAVEYETSDPNFRISWLLGLEVAPGRCPRWASQFETEDRDFRVSYLLGLIPPPELHDDGEKQHAEAEGDEATQEHENEEGEKAELDDDLGLSKLFGDVPYEEENVTEDESSPETSEDAEPPVLATPDFLELCQEMENMLNEIEESAVDADDASDTESIDGVSPEDHEEESASKTEWLRQKTVEFAENKYLDRLMSLPGLEETKAMFLNARAKIKAAIRRETSLKKDNFDVVFTGNEGTGKSTMAKLYAKFLVAEGLFKPNPGHNAISKPSSYYFSKTEVVEQARNNTSEESGHIILLDDAHLIDKDDVNLFNLYTRLKGLPGIIVIILAGDADNGLNNQLQYRAQVEKQLRVIRLPNYTEQQLCVIFSRMVQKWFNKKMKLDGEVPDKYVKVLIRRLRRGATDENFTNVWPVKKAFIEASRRQVERFRQARKEGRYLEDFFMTKEDIMGVKPAFDPDKSAAWKELQELNGLDDVKESILSIVNQANQNYEREAQGKDPLQMTPNRVFLGNPGTGKTTVARLYGKILADFGVLSKGDLILKNPADLIDRYIGWSERNTKEALAEAEGSVLIIDDAHMLDPGKRGNGCSFRHGILDTLVAEVTGAPGEDLCVILCGYPDHMKDMYANSNPGLARRFPLDTAFKFEDFDAKKLSEILDMKLQKERLPVMDKAREVAMDMLKRASVRPGFGNGAEVANLVSKAALARAKRVEERSNQAAGPEEVKVDDIPIEPEDFDPDWDRSTRAVANTRALFEGMIGFEDIIAKFESYQYMAQGMRLRNIDPRPYIPFTYVFKGPPGTGKTTTARKMGQIFYDMGLLAAPDVIDVSASQLVGEYCGQTGPKTMRLLESALGKVLFIDEAYRLAGGDPSSFQSEAVSELVDAVTKPKFARKLIIILAGYDDDMDRLMRVNPGLRSRFATELEFRPLRAEQHMEQLRKVVGKVGITIQPTTDMDAATRGTLINSLNRMSGDKGWASGRSVETLGETVIAHIFKECAIKGYTGSELTVTGRDLVHILAGSGVDSMSVRSWNSRPMGPRQVMTLKDLEGDQW